MKFSIASYSFHRLLAAGQQDVFKYIQDSKELGAAELDPWNGHLVPVKQEDEQLKSRGDQGSFSAGGHAFLDKVKQAAAVAGLPVACLAVDGAHIYEPTPEARQANRGAAYRWLHAAQQLGAAQIRLDAGGTAEMSDEMFEIVVEGYHDILKRAADLGLEVVMENHWGSTNVPYNVLRILSAVDGLGLLFDSNNWAEGMRDEGWNSCAQYARSVHIKAFDFDANGNETTTDLPRVIRLLRDTGYNGVWGIESVPKDGDEYAGVKKTQALIQRVLEG